MIVRRLEDVVGTKGEVHGGRRHSLRLLDAADGMGLTLTDSILEAGFERVFWQKNHLEACYCLEGEGTLEALETGTLHAVKPGTLFAMDKHDRHRIRARTRMRLIATVTPPLTGDEGHDADSSL